MYNIRINNKLYSFPTLDTAMEYAKLLGVFVNIQGPDFVLCGKFGVDSVENGKLPDGSKYDWNKDSRIGN